MKSFDAEPCCLTVKKPQMLLHIIKEHTQFCDYIKKEIVNDTEFEALFEDTRKKEVSTQTLISAFKSAFCETKVDTFRIATLPPFITAKSCILVVVNQHASYLQTIVEKMKNVDYFSDVSIVASGPIRVVAKSSLLKVQVMSNDDAEFCFQIIENIEKETIRTPAINKALFVFAKVVGKIDGECSFTHLAMEMENFVLSLKAIQNVSNAFNFENIQMTVTQYFKKKNLDFVFPDELFSVPVSSKDVSLVIAFAGIPPQTTTLDIQTALLPFKAIEFLFYQPSFFSSQTRKCGVFFARFDTLEDSKRAFSQPKKFFARHAEYFEKSIFEHPPSGFVQCTMDTIAWLTDEELILTNDTLSDKSSD
ncbi:hypothetical protein EIN_222770 [Entamoeba invadens IP1]|uniref:Uncharacterized protein n=1 Tax=Entamoeba invadens IP1 TaxID=370355 RepID=A0A0A1U262_ENTIV|nr:hypothetical protein EIN_222770 [Entamoeba invadens IP1]ELP88114.1 hypothetical protein EIN_222770 [Entamoeba invadens IP1]|eukprot:XP_004254885.1 hypothetical protein EIN_222770 [Entamoeba invadens IP1]